MLTEKTDVRQVPGDRRRRCFFDDALEVVIWYEPAGSIFGFQICYDPQGEPRALTWTRKSGMSHAAIDGGEESVLSNRSPMLRSHAKYDAAPLRKAFQEASGDLPEDERNFIEAKLAGA